MKPETFKHDNATITVRAQTVFERDSFHYVIQDVAKPIVKGYGIEELTDVPVTLDVMLTRYIRWMMVSTIEGETTLPQWGDWFDYVSRNTDKYADFCAWLSLIREDSTLLDKWATAFNKANRQPDTEEDEKKGKTEPVAQKSDTAT